MRPNVALRRVRLRTSPLERIVRPDLQRERGEDAGRNFLTSFFALMTQPRLVRADLAKLISSFRYRLAVSRERCVAC